MEHDFPVDKLRKQLEKAQAMDPDRKRFGAKSHQYQWNPPARREEIEQFEEKIGVSLPKEYRDFLLYAGNGGAGPYYGLWSLERVSWLNWEIEPEKEPFLSPDKTAADVDENDPNWLRGCIPIGAQGDTYLIGLMVAGPNRGRVVYWEYEKSWFFFPQEPDFLAWYQRWLRELCCGYHIFWFATNLDGDEQQLKTYYAKAKNEADKLKVISAMYKFPVLSQSAAEFVQKALWEQRNMPDAKPFLPLLYRASPECFYRFLEYRWETGLYAAVVSELRYAIRNIEEEKTRLCAVWWKRVLEKLPQLMGDVRLSAIEILRKSGEVSLKQVAWVLQEEQDSRRKQDLLYTFAWFPDAAEQLEVWLEELQKREDLELLTRAIDTAPKVPDPRLKEAIFQIQKDFSFAVERIVHLDRNNEEEVQRSIKRTKEYRVYCTAHKVHKEIWYEENNPQVQGVPRPYRLCLRHVDEVDLGLGKALENGNPMHPMVALAIFQQFHRMPPTAYDWAKTLEKIKKLTLELNSGTVRCWNDEERTAELYIADEHPLPQPYYYALEDWSVIGKMKNLKNLKIAQICVEDFSFLPQCKSLEQLSLYNTNFSDCRILRQIPRLKRVDLRLCRLEHLDALQDAPFSYCLAEEPDTPQ